MDAKSNLERNKLFEEYNTAKLIIQLLFSYSVLETIGIFDVYSIS